MPQLDVTTKTATSVWKSPDGQREIFELGLEYEGKPVKAKTYSKDIATVGWSGTVETYEKPGRNGSETFVKQPPKEGGSYGGSSGSQGGYRGGGGKHQADPFTMYLSYAKDAAIASVHEGKFDGGLYQELLEAIEAGGAQLYAGRPDAPKPSETKAPEPDVVHEVTDEPIDLGKIDEIFGDKEKEE